MEKQLTKAPHIKYNHRATSNMRDIVVALIFLVFMSILYYGPRALVVTLVSVVTCDVLDRLCLLMQKKDRSGNFSAVITGLIIALVLPASIPYYIVVVAGFFAIAITKHTFGGLGNNILNPACTGISLIMITWPSHVLNFPEPQDISSWNLPIFGEITTKLTPSMVASLKEASFTLGAENGQLSKTSILTLLTGNHRGGMGVTASIVILACFLFLLARKTITWHAPVSFLATIAIFAMINPRLEADIVSGLAMAFIELGVGTVLFAAVFMVTDPVTTPSFKPARIVYGVGAGLLTMLIRYHGQYAESVTFAILIMNALSGFFDKIILDFKTKEGFIYRLKSTYKAYTETDEYEKLQGEVLAENERKKILSENKKEQQKIKKMVTVGNSTGKDASVKNEDLPEDGGII